MDRSNYFITTFRTIQGPIGLRKRIVHLLLKNLSQQDTELHDRLVTQLTPANYMERILHLDVLLYFKNVDKLKQILLGDNEELTCILLKNRWFILHLHTYHTSEEIVGELLAQLSLAAQYTFIKYSSKYVNNESTMDLFFDAVFQYHGMHLAKHLLKACSVEKIKKVITSENVPITRRDLLRIFKKDCGLLPPFIKHQPFAWLAMDKKLIAGHVITKNPDVYLDNMSEVSLGRRATRKLLLTRTNVVVENSNWFITRLHHRTVYKCLKRDHSILFLKQLCLSRTGSVYNEIRRYLEFFPFKERFDIFSKTFELVKGMSIWNVDDRSILETALSELVPIPLDIMYALGIDSSNFELCYTNKTYIVDLLIKRLRYSIGVSTLSHIRKLVEAAKFFRCSYVLDKVLSFFCVDVRRQWSMDFNFLNYLLAQYDLSKCQPRQWIAIKIIAFRIPDSEIGLDLVQKTCLKHISCLWKTSSPFIVKHFFLWYVSNKAIIRPYTPKIELSALDDMELQNFLFDPFVKVLPKVFTNKKELIDKDMYCILWIIGWNLRNKEDKIAFASYPRLLKSFEEAVRHYAREYDVEYIFRYLTRTDLQDEHTESLTDLYFKIGLNVCPEVSAILWHLKYNHAQSLKYRIKIMEALFNIDIKNVNVWLCLRRYGYVQIISNFCTHLAQARPHSTRILIVLAVVTDIRDYRRMLERQLKKLEWLPNRTMFEQIRLVVIKSLKYTKSLATVSFLIQLSDYSTLTHTFDSLYFLMRHLPIEDVSELLQQTAEFPLMKKHKICLCYQLRERRFVCSLFEPLLAHPPIRLDYRHKLRAAIKYFVKNPSEDFFELIIKFVVHHKLEDNPDLLRVNALYLRDLPLAFKGKYLLRSVELLTSSYNDLATDIFSFYCCNEGMMVLTPPTSADQFIERCVNDENSKLDATDEEISKFIALYICYCDRDNTEKFKLVQEKFKKYTTHNWKNLYVRTVLQKILEAILTEIRFILRRNQYINTRFEKTVNAMALLESYKTSWPSFFSVTMYRPTYIKINVLLVLYETNDTDEHSRRFLSLLTYLNGMCRLNVSHELADAIEEIIIQDTNTDIFMYMHSLCVSLWSCSNSINCALLILRLLPRIPPHGEENVVRYNRLVRCLSFIRTASVVEKFQEYTKERGGLPRL